MTTSLSAPAAHSRAEERLGSLVDSIATLERMEASIAAFKAQLIEQARQCSELLENSEMHVSPWTAQEHARRVLVSELACALRLPERTAERLVANCTALVTTLHATLNALSSGEISWRHATVMVDHASSLDDEFATEFEGAVLPFARSLTVAKFDRAARRERERRHPESIGARHEIAADGRFVEFKPARDGMVWLTAYLPATSATGIYNRLTDLAMKHQSAAETRTLTQMRADLLCELLLDGGLDAGRDFGIRPRVLITVPVLTLLGHTDEPAELEGYGPIDLATALELAAAAPSFTRLLTHPETGAVLSVGRASYAVPADLRTWLRVRDGTCRFPGCSRGARSCEIDHTKDWQFGHGTSHDNLAHLCPAHHRLKHSTGWAVRQLDDGVLQWISPTGRTYRTDPQTRMGATAA